MDQKIAWYKEILELEPSSRIFFPLARLLARDGHTRYAIEALQHGLQHHKDFFEARLMLIELLHSVGDVASRDGEVRTLLACFAEYPQFWDAWGDCLAHDGAESEVSLAMRFIAARQQNTNISFASIFHKGLQSLTKKDDCISDSTLTVAPFEDSPVMQAKENATTAKSTVPSFFDESIQVVDYADFVLQERQGLLEHDAPQVDMQERELDISCDTNVNNEQDVDVLLESQNACGMDFDYSAAFDSTENSTQNACSKEYKDFSRELQSISLCKNIVKTEQNSCSELFSLRTRSMAEVLTNQGDIQGALAIYDELLLTEKSEALRYEIQERINALRSSKSCFELHDAVEVPCHGKEKLLQMLTLLAERLDSRAQ